MLHVILEVQGFLQGLLGVSALLAVPEYRRAVLEGLVASIGGLDASLCKEASAAFVQTLTAADPGNFTAPVALLDPKAQIQYHSDLLVMLIPICSVKGSMAGYMSYIYDWACLHSCVTGPCDMHLYTDQLQRWCIIFSLGL